MPPPSSHVSSPSCEPFRQLTDDGDLVGKSDGLVEGKVLGEALGLTEGKALGEIEGLADGLTVGKTDGLAEGLHVGLVDGCCVEQTPSTLFDPSEVHANDAATQSRPSAQSASVQHPSPDSLHGSHSPPPQSSSVSKPLRMPSLHPADEGDLEGDIDGDIDGENEGLSEGENVGDRDGLQLGESDGSKLGDRLGESDGESLGLKVGGHVTSSVTIVGALVASVGNRVGESVHPLTTTQLASTAASASMVAAGVKRK